VLVENTHYQMLSPKLLKIADGSRREASRDDQGEARGIDAHHSPV
jgi:hypothetical protein